MNTKIETGFNKIGRIRDLADLAKSLFPHNRRHQKVFLAIFIELKYADGQSLSSLNWIVDKYKISRRIFEIVRAKMRRLGIIDHISRFNRAHGYREAWMFSKRFNKSLMKLCDYFDSFRESQDYKQELKDRDLFKYL